MAKSVLILLRLTTAPSATDAAIHKKMFRSGTMTLMIINEEMNDIIKIVKSLEDLVDWYKVLAKQLEMKTKSKKVHFSVFS